MNSPLNARIIPTLYADCPSSFEERVDGRMAYEDNGEGGFFLMRGWLNEAEPDFKETELYAELVAVFAAFPEEQEVVLVPHFR